MNRLIVAGAYTVTYWVAKPVAEVIAWVWTQVEHVHDRNRELRDPNNWYSG
jgi:hypothetical protein